MFNLSLLVILDGDIHTSPKQFFLANAKLLSVYYGRLLSTKIFPRGVGMFTSLVVYYRHFL